MTEYVSMTCQIYNNVTNTNLGVKKITMMRNDDSNTISHNWDAIDRSDTCPSYPMACTIASFGKFLLIYPPGSDLPPHDWYMYKESLKSATHTTGYIILQVPDGANDGRTLWTITFPQLSGNREITISVDGTVTYFNYYKNGVHLGRINAGLCGKDWGTQWGYRRGSLNVCGFPCISSDGTAVGSCGYSAFVVYTHPQGQLPNPPKIMRCSLSCGGSSLDGASIWNSFFGDDDVIDEADKDNPYDNIIDENNQGGEDTNFADNSDDVSEDELPSIDAVGTGFATIFTPSKQQLRALSELFWDSNFFTFMQNLVENINQMFTSLAMVPFAVTQGSTVEVTWLGFAMTGIYLTLASKQYYEFDMGTIDLANDDRIFKYDNCLDYSPFSKLGIFLPFIGYQDLDIDECRNKTIHLIYRVDILSGACVALIKLNGSTIYQFSGNCLTQIPITSESMTSAISDVVNVGIAAASARVAGAASAADMAAVDSSEKMSQAQKDAHKMHAEVTRTNADNHLRSAAANATMGIKPQYNKSGSVSSSVSMLSVKQPYLFLTTSKLVIPKNYEHYAGFPSNITGKLNSFSGFTVVDSIRLNNLVATAPEVEEIYKLLRSGVII